MNFQPRTEQQIADSKLWNKGLYDFEILDAFERKSKAGNPMMELKHRLTDGNRSRIISDYLLDETPEKLRHACAACGLLDKYETGCLSNDDFVGKRGQLKLIVEKAKDGYPAKNVIGDYLVAGVSAAARSALDLLAQKRLPDRR